MTYVLDTARGEVIAALNKWTPKGYVPHLEELETPPDKKMGDFAFPCFELAKLEKRSPVELATELAAKIGPTDHIEKIESAGPYVNFYLASKVLTEETLDQVTKMGDKYGQSEYGKGKKVLIEYAALNTHKLFHVGHIRNVTLGQSLINLYRAIGYDVISSTYIGDIGAHVAKVIWLIEKDDLMEELRADSNRANRLGDLYVEATKRVKDNESLKEEVDETLRRLEDKDSALIKIWKETREWSLTELKKGFSLFHALPENWMFESEVEEPGKQIVKQMLIDGIAKKSEGAVIVDLEDEGLDVFLALKSDGSSLYATKDLALAYKKKEQFNPDRQLFVVDERQAFYFKQLFAVLKRLGFTKHLHHVSYDFVTLEDGAMSSRKGNIVTLDETIEKMTAALAEETRSRHKDWRDKKVTETAESIALAAITFMMLRQDPKALITFKEDEAMSFDGFTGPYLLYTFARIQRILETAPKVKKSNMGKLSHDIETELVKLLAEYPDIVESAATHYNPASLAKWLFSLAKKFAEYYQEVRILDDEDTERMAARLTLLKAVQQVVKSGLGLLTIEPVNEM
jgi:arginyl-tRNA synthetase